MKTVRSSVELLEEDMLLYMKHTCVTLTTENHTTDQVIVLTISPGVPGGTSWLAARYFLSDCRLA